MTLSELLHSVTFEEIAPYIVKYHGDDKCMAGYKMHYDLLWQMKPLNNEGDNNTTTISIYEDEDAEENDTSVNSQLLDAYPLEGDYWEVSLAKELIINSDVNATWAEIAACCLFHTSFYGFTQDDQKDCFDRWIDEMSVNDKLKKYKQIYGENLPSRKQMLKKRSFHRCIKRKISFHRKFKSSTLSKIEKKLIGSIKRKWRMWKRWTINREYIRIIIGRCDFFYNIIEGGKMQDNPIPSHLEIRSRFLHAEQCNITSYRTYAKDAASRVYYFRELVEKYNALEGVTLPNCMLSIKSSSLYEITNEEIKELSAIISQISPNMNIQLIQTGYEEDLGMQIKLDIAFYES